VVLENIHGPPQGGSWEILGGGCLTPRLLKYEAKLGFPERCGGSNQKPFVGGVWIFSGTTHYHARD